MGGADAAEKVEPAPTLALIGKSLFVILQNFNLADCTLRKQNLTKSFVFVTKAADATYTVHVHMAVVNAGPL